MPNLDEFRRRAWVLVPGPERVPSVLDSQSLQGTIAEYTPEEIADAILSIPGVRFTGERTDWGKWKAEVSLPSDVFAVNITLFERTSHSSLWGGSEVAACSQPSSLLWFWRQLRRTHPRVWLHSSECKIYNPSDFGREYVL